MHCDFYQTLKFVDFLAILYNHVELDQEELLSLETTKALPKNNNISGLYVL